VQAVCLAGRSGESAEMYPKCSRPAPDLDPRTKNAAPWAAIRLCVEHRYSVLVVTE